MAPRDSYRARVTTALNNADHTLKTTPGTPWVVVGSRTVDKREMHNNAIERRLWRIVKSSWFRKNYPHVTQATVDFGRTPGVPLRTGNAAFRLPSRGGNGNYLDLFVQLAYLKNIERTDNQEIALHGAEFSRAMLDLLKRWDRPMYDIVYAEFRKAGIKTRVWSEQAKANAKGRKVNVDPAKTQADLIALLQEFDS